jgi:exonuclease SbcC
MIPEKLTLKGIYSYQQKVEIYFNNLMAAGIFGIFGAVGSGKSTILEAISFAMYGETERLNNRDSKLYNMMNLRSNEMEIDFIFRHLEEKYRFTAFARRNSKNFEDISKNERKAYHWKNEQWIPMESADATHVTGLKYDHFKQIVIIPQGKFNEFVQLSATDRTKMLRELFPLDRFDLKEPVSKLFSAVKINITSIEGRLQELEEYKDEKVGDLEKEINEGKSNLEKTKKLLQSKEKERSKALELKELLSDFHKIRRKLDELNSQRSDFEQLKQRVEIYEQTRLKYAHLLNRLNELENELSQNKSQKDKLNQQNDQVEAQKSNIKKSILQIKEQIGDIDVHRTQIGELEKVIKIQSVEKEIEIIKQAVDNLEVSLKKENQKHDSIKIKIENHKKSLKELKENMADESQLFQLKQFYNDEDNLNERLLLAKNELNKVESLVSELTSARIQIVNSVYEELYTQDEAKSLKMNDAIELIQLAIKRIDAELVEGEAVRDQLSIRSHLVKHAEQLKEGEKCPLCGSMEHPDPYLDEKTTEERQVIQEKLKNRRAIKEQLSNALIKLDGLKTRFQQEGSQIKERKQQVEVIQKALKDSIAKQQEISLSLTRDELKNELKKLEEHKKKILGIEKEIQENEKVLDNQKTLNEINIELDEKKSVHSQLLGQLSVLSDEVSEKWLSYSNSEIETKLKQIKSSLKKLQIDSDQLVEVEKQHDRITLELGQNDKIHKDLTKKLTGIKDQIDNQLKKDKFSSLNEVKQVLSANIDLVESKKQIEQFFRDLHLIENKEAELNAKVEEQTFDEEKFKQIESEYQALKLKISQYEEQLGALQNQLNELNKKLTIKHNLEDELAGLDKRKQNLEVLNRLLRGDGFVRYVSQIYLQQLCSIANERFKKLTYNHLELDIDEKYNFIVRDYLHEGKTRLLKTLSGGQTFQAALSLAMALSEQIQQYQKVKQQFFFMDEGFGSLDKASLSLVFDTLKQLRNEERTVGIISHVEELQTEIDHFIMVNNDQEQGSSVTFNS